MIASMTGFGAAAAEGTGVRVRVVLRSVNGRFLDLQIRCPSSLQEFEARIKERIQARITRGKVTGAIEWEEDADGGAKPVLNEEAARTYIAELARLAQLASLEGKPALELLARLPGVFRTESVSPDPSEAERLVMEAVDAAVDELETMRQTEGEALARDLTGRIALIEEHLGHIESMAGSIREHIRTRLREKVEALLRPGEVNEERLAMEVVLLAERSDITEEIVRFRSHNAQFLDALSKGGEVGRRLNFLLQEMHRESNTITSKASEADLIHRAVEVKEEVERLREQIQNLA